MRPSLPSPYVLICCFIAATLCSCGGGSSSPPPPTGNPVPAVQSFSPSSAAAGANGFTLAINGSNFLSSSTVTWNGATKQSTFVSASQLTIPVLATDLSASATVPVAVTNPSPGGGQASANFSVSAAAAPNVTSVSPNTLGAGTGAITLTVTGTNFVSNSVVQWNGQSRPTTYVSNTQLTVAIPATDLTTAVTSLPVTVMTPNSGSSNSVAVAVVTPALPTISSLTPNQVVLGGSAFTLTVNGTNFVGGALVYWNGVSRVTQFVSATQLTASILAADVAPSSTNSASVTVQDPAPNAGISAPATFTLENPTPQVTSISPNTAIAGTTAAVAISGTGFISGATAQFGGQVLATTFNSSTSLSVQIESDTVSSGNLTVANPAPSAGPSNAVTFTSTAAGHGLQLTIANLDSTGNVATPVYDAGGISSTGRYFSFVREGSAGNVAYLRDTCLGAPSGCTPSTVSYGTFGTPPYFDEHFPIIWVSTDGLYAALADTQMYPATYTQNVLLLNTCVGVASGCTPGSSVATIQNTANGSMAQNGRYLSYGQGPGATNEIGPAPMTTSIFDTCIGAPAGCTQSTIVPSVTTTALANGAPAPIPSADGRYLVYEKFVSPNQNLGGQIILHDSCLGAAPGCTPSEQTVSDPSMTTVECRAPAFSPDAAYVAWNCGNELFLRATCLASSSGCSTTPTQIPLPNGLPATAGFVSAGGRFTAFTGQVPSSPGNLGEVYVYDSCNGGPAGCTPQTVLVSLNSAGAVANGGAAVLGMSNDGKYILFQSYATNLLPVPSNFQGVVFFIAVNPLL